MPLSDFFLNPAGAATGMVPGRQPSLSELQFFKDKPQVQGYAAPDNSVVMNPNSNLTPKEKSSVFQNERIRLMLRSNPNLIPKIALTPQQSQLLDSTDYKNAPEADRIATWTARILSGDPSAGQPTLEQLTAIEALRALLK